MSRPIKDAITQALTGATINVAANATFDLNGNAETVGALAGSGSVTFGSSASPVFVVGGIVLVALSVLGVSFIREAEEQFEVHRPASVPVVPPSFDGPADVLETESGADEPEPVVAGERR